MFTLVQGVVLPYKEDNPRTCDVIQYPDHYLLQNVRLPLTLLNQTKPLPGSIVLVAREDSYRAYIITILRDPNDYLTTSDDIRGGAAGQGQQLQPGEIFFEARGDASSPGFGPTFHMGNDGTINLHSGKRKEYIRLGGTDDDNDGEIILNCDNGFFQSNVNHLTTVQSSVRFDENNQIQIVNNAVTIFPTPDTPPLEVPIAELNIDTLGKVVLRNATLGVTKDLLEFDVSGQLMLQNQFASLQMSATGAVTNQSTLSYGITAGTSFSMSASTSASLSASSTMSLSSSGNMTLTGSTINLNSGTFGVARLNDTVTSNISIDPTWWTFWSTLATQIAALPTTPLDGGATLKAGLAALFATVPLTIISKITTASSTVKAGG